MNIDAARYTVRQSFQIARELQSLLPFLKERCDAEEYRQYAIDIAKAVDAVSVALLNRAIETHPDLANEIENRISTYGHYF
ncbi:MAG: hypothetical protein JSS22_02245 [Proteobacteria bacterium]|nr:hypothetical protein [Pseudomonadota bacterium]